MTAATPSLDTDKRQSLWCGGLLLGLFILALPAFIEPPAGLSEPAWRCACLALMMICFWALEIIPPAITALLPLLLTPLLGIIDIKTAAEPYAQPVIFLFMGGFVLGLAMEKWHLHSRIALKIMTTVGADEQRLVLGFLGATGLISMWVSNTATTIMMMPIALSIISLKREQNDISHDFPTALLLAIAYGASIGGFGTLIGTPPNALLSAFLESQYNITLGFAKWMLMGVSASALMLIAAAYWLAKRGYRLATHHNPDIEQAIHNEQQKLGSFTRPQALVLTIFLLTAAAWVLRPWLISLFPNLPITDTAIALFAMMLLFSIPAQWKPLQFLMDWKKMKQLPWDVLMLFGGGLSLAKAIRETGLADWIADSLGILSQLPPLFIIGCVVLVIIFLTEVTSNLATTAAFLPPLGALAMSMGMNPAMLAIPAAIAASCAFMLPVATPPNAIVYGAGFIPLRQMMRAGMVLNVVGIVVITLLSYLLVDVVVG